MTSLALVLWSLMVPLQDSQLATLRTTILSLRELPDEDRREVRGATAQLTVAKHQLRDWVEGRLGAFTEIGDALALAEQLREGLTSADLYCTDYNEQCFPSSMGFLDDIQVNREREFLVITTAVGIWCGFDYSAYVYRWSGNRWQRVWSNEQNTYTEKKYLPQLIHAVRMSDPDRDGNRLLMTLGSKPGCASAFLDVYYRVWRMNARNEVQKLLVDGTELGNLDSDPPIDGRIGPGDALIGFTLGGTGYGYSHKALRHFEVRNGRARQVDPIAVTPRDFVEEWLNSKWAVSEPRSESPSLRQWHTRLYRDDGMGDFPDPTMRCAASPELWQVATHLNEVPTIYYLVRWRQPFSFTMVGISNSPYTDCTVADPQGDWHPELFR